jgi:hypothetical protein
MFAFAPITRFIAWLTTDPGWAMLRSLSPSPLGVAALAVAREEIGKGESGGNNQGPDLDRYRGGGKGGAWCAAFVFFCLLTACERRGRLPPVKRSHGARQLFRRIVAAGMLVRHRDIRPGDVVLWARGAEGSWTGHIGIVSEVERDDAGTVTIWQYVAGNEGSYPALVRERAGRSRRLIGFARVD